MSTSCILTKSTLFGAISRSTAHQSIYIPAASLHLSSVLSRESVVDKAKDIARDANIAVGKKLANAVDGAENIAKATTKKSEDVKENASQHVASVNKDFGNKVSHVMDSAEDAAETVSQKGQELKREATNKSQDFKQQASHAADRFKHGASNEKTILDTVEDVYERAKEAVGLGAKKAGNSADELKDEAKLGAKKAAKRVDETRQQASKEIKDKF